jgi:hypothetical protein
MTDREFSVGDRVRIRAETADSWKDKKMRARVGCGLPATVTEIVGTRLPARERIYRIEFDRPGGLGPFTESVSVSHLEPVQPMSDAPKNLCLSCNLAKWDKTANGRVHPSGKGTCGWKPPHILTPAAWRWEDYDRRQPSPMGGYIFRKDDRPVVECETYQVLDAKP